MDRDLAKGLRRSAASTLAEAKANAPRSTRSAPGYRHLADTLKVGVRGGSLVIYSGKPGGRVVHWGGRHPLFGNRAFWYSQPPNPFISRAIERHEDRIIADVGDAIEDHARFLGWR